MFSDRRVLVTGGAGFIGSHLCERLLGRGDEVLCADNFFTATRPNVSGLMLNSRFELVRHDVRFSNRPSGSSTFRLSTTPVSMSLTGSRFSSDSAPRPLYGAF